MGEREPRETDELGSLVADILVTLENVGAQGVWADLVLAI